jgi:hypothetical protein
LCGRCAATPFITTGYPRRCAACTAASRLPTVSHRSGRREPAAAELLTRSMKRFNSQPAAGRPR